MLIHLSLPWTLHPLIKWLIFLYFFLFEARKKIFLFFLLFLLQFLTIFPSELISIAHTYLRFFVLIDKILDAHLLLAVVRLYCIKLFPYLVPCVAISQHRSVVHLWTQNSIWTFVRINRIIIWSIPSQLAYHWVVCWWTLIKAISRVHRPSLQSHLYFFPYHVQLGNSLWASQRVFPQQKLFSWYTVPVHINLDTEIFTNFLISNIISIMIIFSLLFFRVFLHFELTLQVPEL